MACARTVCVALVKRLVVIPAPNPHHLLAWHAQQVSSKPRQAVKLVLPVNPAQLAMNERAVVVLLLVLVLGVLPANTQ